MVIKTASPGVIVNEVDLTRGTSDAITTNVGALAGPFKKGPVDKITLIEQEVDLIDTFGAPTDENYEYFYSVDNFLEYGGVAYVVRCDDALGGQQTMRNAADGAKADAQGNEIVYYVKNEDDFEENFFNVDASMGGLPTKFLAQNPGTWGNSLAIAVIDSGADYELTLYADRAWDQAGTPEVVTDEVYFDKSVTIGSSAGAMVSVAAPVEATVIPPAFSDVKVASTENFDLSTGLGKVGSVTITDGGSGYTAADGVLTHNVTDGSGVGAIFQVTLVAGEAQSGIVLANGGSGYEVGNILIIPSDTGDANQITVDSIEIGGTIATFSETQLGTGLVTPNGTTVGTLTTTTSGLGNALRLDLTITAGVVTAATPNPSANSVNYYVGDTGTITGGVSAATYTVATLASGETVDGILISEGDRALLKDQTDASENGVYYRNGSSMLRAADADAPGDFTTGKTVKVLSGAQAGDYEYTGSDNPTVGTSDLTFATASVYTLIGAGDFVTASPSGATAYVNAAKDGQYKLLVVSGTINVGDTLSKDGGTNNTGEATEVNSTGEYIIYSYGAKDEIGNIIDERLVNVIFKADTKTYEEGLELGWPAPVGGKQRLPIDGDRAKTTSGDVYVWMAKDGAWVNQFKPAEGDFVTDGTKVYQVDSIDGWYEKQIAFQGIPWYRFAGRPSTTLNANDKGAKNDEMHVIVYDANGDITGSKGNVIESFFGVSKLKGAKTPEGDNNYYIDVINRKSVNVFANQDVDGPKLAQINEDFDLDGPGFVIGDGVNCTFIDAMSYMLTGGVDQLEASLGELQAAYQKFIDENVEDMDYVIQGPSLANADDAIAKANFVISIAESKKDCMAFISPPKYAAVDPLKADIITERVVEFFDELSSSSYAVFDSGYKMTYDRFNDKQRYVPLNGDIAGLLTNASLVAEPWYSPAGVVRGQIRNVTRLSYNPSKEQRDVLYSSRVNPISTFAGEGTILYGDKTALAYSSAFDRINVRRLFLIIEKEIAKISRSVLFEFNDQTTRSMFKNNVNPYLRDIKSRRGMTDFLVVCDESNNTPEVIDRNEFVADIYIKPNRSINFVTLNFIATKTGVTFSEAVGLFRR